VSGTVHCLGLRTSSPLLIAEIRFSGNQTRLRSPIRTLQSNSEEDGYCESIPNTGSVLLGTLYTAYAGGEVRAE
jgi:hypothetical protein